MAQSFSLRRVARATSSLGGRHSRVFIQPRAWLHVATAEEAAARLADRLAGRVSVRRQVVDANQLQKLALTLGRPRLGDVDVSAEPPPAGTPVPPGYHLVYFTPGVVEAELGPDGTDVAMSAPAPFTRRMWAGGRMSWSGTGLWVGDHIEELTRLVSATAKKSRSGGEMVLVEVDKEIRGPRGSSVVDRRSWMFRLPLDAAQVVHAAPVRELVDAPSRAIDINRDGGDASSTVREMHWSAVGLFRFSALTFNGHKIHYSEEWCRSVEGHPTLVVHGPLNLVCILDYWRDVYGHGGEPASVTYRALAPVYAGETYHIRTRQCAVDGVGRRTCEIIAEKYGVVCMAAEVLA